MDNLEFAVTYVTVTPESVEYGDYQDTGFEYESITFDYFAELVDFIKSKWFCMPSEYPCKRITRDVWLSTDFEYADFETGEQVQYSIHAKNDRAARYLNLAAYVLRIIK